jgi:hypothetical protein
MQLTPSKLAAVYDCLRAFPPFRGWKLPESDEVAFGISLSPDTYGTYDLCRGQPRIEISVLMVSDFQSLVETMAHEMIHLHQCRAGRAVDHDAEWQRLATRVCREFGWKREGF